MKSVLFKLVKIKIKTKINLLHNTTQNQPNVLTINNIEFHLTIFIPVFLYFYSSVRVTFCIYHRTFLMNLL